MPYYKINIDNAIGEIIYRHEDGYEFRVDPETWSGAKHERWTSEGFEVIETIGKNSERFDTNE